jgi:hypothetical protein
MKTEMRPTPTCPSLALVENPVATNDPCAICGTRCDPTGVDLVLVDEAAEGSRLTWALVCDPCGREHAPELQRVREDAARLVGHAHRGECCLCGCPGPCRVHDRTGPLSYDDGYTRDAELDQDQREALTKRYGRPATGLDGTQVWPAEEAGSDP